MEPPLPPSPPDGPPRGTYFSRRNATQPLPPSPPFTKILASSTNTGKSYQETPPDRGSSGAWERTRPSPQRPPGDVYATAERGNLIGGFGFGGGDADEAAAAATGFKIYVAGDQRKQCVVFSLAHVLARLGLGAALGNQNRAGIYQFAPQAPYA